MPALLRLRVRREEGEQSKERVRACLQRAWMAVTRGSKRAGRTLSRPARSASKLPPELWHLILREATLPASDPDPLATPSDLSFLQSPAPDPRRPDYLACMRTKSRLALVCRAWRASARQFLYEFVWIARAAQAKALAHALLLQGVAGGQTDGRWIRRLHIQTSVLERCPPADLRTIVSCAPQLVVFTDHQSVRRNRYEESPDPKCSPEKIFQLLVHRDNKLRRISWTCYDDTPVCLDVAPWVARAATLDYLELSSCSPNFSAPDPTGIRAVSLPCLRSLKVSLDNVTFAVLARWDMPALTNLSVVSADYSYAGPGFAAFFERHGPKIRQLELGHSSSLVEEYVLARPRQVAGARIRLAEWCPNLREFICSADAEWHWETPDWIAPHVLLPSHPTLEFIGIRDMDTRLRADALVLGGAGDADAGGGEFFSLLEQLTSLLRTEAFPRLRYVRDLSEESHWMRTVRPEPRVVGFWARVVRRCAGRGVWLEDWEGVNVTLRGLKRASLNL